MGSSSLLAEWRGVAGWDSKVWENFHFPAFGLQGGAGWRQWGQVIEREVREIEVEVVEDGGVRGGVVRRMVEDGSGEGGGKERDAEDWREWRHWQGRAKTLDLRWWPLWVVLGGIAVVVLLTLGLAIAVVYGVLRLVARLLRALAR